MSGASCPADYRYKKHRLSFKKKPRLMGIVNITPDSFSDGGDYLNRDKAVRHAEKLIEDGADMLDIGGESTRPGASPLTADEEIKRVIPVIKQLVKRRPKTVISIDSYKPEVAQAALEEGAAMINDITGMQNPAMIEVAGKWKAPVVIMHMKGTPGTMQRNPRYQNVVKEITTFFKKRIEVCQMNGIDKIILDPGIGFGKTVNHNLEILRGIGDFVKLGYPVMIGASRKSFMEKVLGKPVDEREEGTAAVTAISVMKGASIIRVHDVRKNLDAARMAHSVLKGN